MTRRHALALILLSSALGIAPVCATELDRCGEYVVEGLFEFAPNTSTLVVHPKSDSEYRLAIDSPPGSGLAPYDKKWLQAKVKISKGGQGFHPSVTLEGIIGTLPVLNQPSKPFRFVKRLKCE